MVGREAEWPSLKKSIWVMQDAGHRVLRRRLEIKEKRRARSLAASLWCT